MKRLIALTLAIVIGLFALTSCTGRVAFDFTNVNDLSDLDGAIIAAQTGTFHLDALTAQTSGVTVKEYADFPALLNALTSNAIDGYVAEEPTALAVVKQDPSLSYLKLVNNSTGFTASDADTGIAVGFKTGSALVDQVNAILAGISAAERSQLMADCVTMNENPDQTLAGFDFGSDKTDTSNGTLKIAMECAYAPFNWSQTTDANGAVKINGSTLYANGYDVQIAKYIAAELGMKLEIVAAEWDNLITGLNAGTYDGIIAGMSPTEEREAEIDFTDCYYNSNLVIIYKK